MESRLIYKEDGVVRDVGGKRKSGALVMVNGIVHTYDSEEMDEPYLKEWGWVGFDQEQEIYRHLYRHMLEGSGNPAGDEKIKTALLAQFGNAGQKVFDRVEADKYATFMSIPVGQFGITEERTLYEIAQRVMNDNPLLIFPLWPSLSDEITVIKDENEVCQYLYSVVPTQDKLAQAREVCREQIGKIVREVEKIYGIVPGDSLTVEQKAKVLKVIHDYIVLHGNLEDSKVVEWWQPTPYAVFDRRYEGLCTSYTMAFCAVARLYGIEAINMTGYAYVDSDASEAGYDVAGEHSWVAVRLSDEEYGAYPSDNAKWSCIDVFWDEPIHAKEAGLTPERDDVIWKYFLNMDEINIVLPGGEKIGHSYRTVDASIAYGALPMVGIPSLSMPYTGNEHYVWEDET